jgi:hypothetical protein
MIFVSDGLCEVAQLLTAAGAASAQRLCVTGGSLHHVGTCRSFAAGMNAAGTNSSELMAITIKQRC